MATICNGVTFGYWNSTSNTRYCYINGTVSRSGNTVTLSGMTMYWTFKYGSWGNVDCTMWVGSSSTTNRMQFGSSSNPVYTSNTVSLNDYSFSVDTTQTSATITIEEGGDTGSFTVSFASGATAPSGLSANVAAVSTDTISLNVYCTNYGTGVGPNYLTAMVLGPTATTEASTPRTVNNYVTTLPSVVTNSSTKYDGGVTISPNTQYSYGVWATNGSLSNRAIYTGGVVTLPPALSAKSVGTITSSSVQISYTTAADGGKYTKNIQYSLNNSTWTTGATVSSASATSGSFTISSLSAYTSYTIYLRVNTTAGSTSSGSLSATTLTEAPSGLTSSVVEAYVNGAKLSGSISSYGAPSSVSGRYIELGICSGSSYSDTPRWLSSASNVTSTTITITDSSITSNTSYYYGIYANNTVSTNSTTNGTFITLPAAPVASAFSATSSTATFNITENSSGTASTVQLQYSYKKSSDSSWGSWTNAGSAGNKHTTTVSLSGLSETDYDVRVRAVAGSLTSAVQTYSNAISILPNPAITITGYTLGKLTSTTNVPVTVSVIFSGTTIATNTYSISLSYYDSNNVETRTSAVTKQQSESTHTFSINMPAAVATQTFRLIAHNTVSGISADSATVTFTMPSNKAVAPAISYSWDSVRKVLNVTNTIQTQPSILETTNYEVEVYKKDANDNETIISTWTSTTSGSSAVTVDLDPELYPNIKIYSIQYVRFGNQSSSNASSLATPYVIRGKLVRPSGTPANIVRVKVKDKNGNLYDGNYQHPFVVK